MSGQSVDLQKFISINRQLENDEKEHSACPFKNTKRFTEQNWARYNNWRQEWIVDKINKENKIVLDDLDLQQFRQLANQFLKPVKEIKRRKN